MGSQIVMTLANLVLALFVGLMAAGSLLALRKIHNRFMAAELFVCGLVVAVSPVLNW